MQLTHLKGTATLIQSICHNKELKQTIKVDTSLIKISQEITILLLFEGFNMVDIGTAILNI